MIVKYLTSGFALPQQAVNSIKIMQIHYHPHTAGTSWYTSYTDQVC